eukprot:CAMPEP_0172807976 /NCGR_PEP_ID=MMETSP1075-20121228/7372_1 /TAXON_ID=2916 /ORGANISM="Ceratium fusus, Strain PA161109" /LENGTH=242 /DNA_ID=CAMNT_0013647045 /DNA_START=189 /DNA_END=917 /DNA_ORIENTATION=+
MSIEYWVVTVHSPDYPQERVANVKQLQAAIPPLRIFGGTNKDHWDDDGPGGARGVLRTLRTSGVAFNWTAPRGKFAWRATYLRFLHYFHEQNHTNFAILLQDDAVVPEGFEHEMQQKVEHLSLDQLKQNHALGYAETGLLTLKTAVPSVIKTICSKTIDMPTDWFHNKQNNDLTDEEDMSHTLTKDEVFLATPDWVERASTFKLRGRRRLSWQASSLHGVQKNKRTVNRQDIGSVSDRCVFD